MSEDQRGSDGHIIVKTVRILTIKPNSLANITAKTYQKPGPHTVTVSASTH